MYAQTTQVATTTVVSITPEQVIVHFELIDGSIMEYPLSPQALQKQLSASDEELQP
jgi:hypothetical protein